MINEVIVVLAVVERIQNQAVKESSENNYFFKNIYTCMLGIPSPKFKKLV